VPVAAAPTTTAAWAVAMEGYDDQRVKLVSRMIIEKSVKAISQAKLLQICV
jgi:hypothetical protein